MIEFINLNDLNLKGISTDYLFADVMIGFKKVNVFFGKNNSGKSRLLRNIFTFQDKVHDRQNNVQTFLYSQHKNNLRIGLNPKDGTLLNHYFNDTHFRSKKDDGFQQILVKNIFPNHAANYINQDTREFIENLAHPNRGIHSPNNIKSEYIPILRGLQPLISNQISGQTKYLYDSIYEKRIKDIYEIPKEFIIHTGENIFEDVKRLLLGDENEREIIYKFEMFLSENIFDGNNITLIPKYGEEILNIKKGNEDQRSITELGDGLQSIIIILFPMFTATKKTIFCIEEPEVHMHPEMQRKLAELIVKLCNDDTYENIEQVFISTHSAHFINIEEAAKFSFTREDNKSVVSLVNSNNDISKELNLMGYLPSDLLQANYIIWVEGPSDKIYVNYLLKKLAPELKEYKHYTIMFYSGSTSKHLLLDIKDEENLIFSMNRNCAYLRDCDIKKKGEKSKYENEINNLVEKGILCWLTQNRELENHIDQTQFLNAIIQIVGNGNLTYVDEVDNFRDRFYVRSESKYKSNYLVKSIYLTDVLFAELGKKKYDVYKIEENFLREELQKCLEVKGEIFNVNKKVEIANFLTTTNDLITDSDFTSFIIKLINEIKKINHIK